MDLALDVPVFERCGAAFALRHFTASPSKIGDITRAALVLTRFEHNHPHKELGEIISMSGGRTDQAAGLVPEVGAVLNLRT